MYVNFSAHRLKQEDKTSQMWRRLAPPQLAPFHQHYSQDQPNSGGNQSMPFPKCLRVTKVNTDQHVKEPDWINKPPT